MILPPSLTFLGRELIALSLLEKKKGRFIDLRLIGWQINSKLIGVENFRPKLGLNWTDSSELVKLWGLTYKAWKIRENC